MTSTGIVAALDFEARCLGPLANAPAIALAVSGPGADAAGKAAESLASAGAGRLISWGTAAALTPHLCAGDLVLADAILDRGECLRCTADWIERVRSALAPYLRCHGGKLHSLEVPLLAPAAKRRLGRETGAVAADMESGAIARCAARHKLEFLAVRVIVDSAGDAVPPAALAALHGPRLALVPVLRALFKSPGELVALLRLAANFRHAHRTLTLAGRVATVDLAS